MPNNEGAASPGKDLGEQDACTCSSDILLSYSPAMRFLNVYKGFSV